MAKKVTIGIVGFVEKMIMELRIGVIRKSGLMENF